MDRTLDHVISHLREVSRRVAEAAAQHNLHALRMAIDDYAALSDNVTRVDGTTRAVAVKGRPAEWSLAENSDPARRLLYIHGGSWMSGTTRAYRPHTLRLAAATGCSVLAIDYRLAPEHAYPAGLLDCVDSFKWMLENGPQGAGRAQEVFMAGDSAGGNLTLAAMLMLRDQGEPLPQCAIAFSPATDLTWSGASFSSRARVEPVLIAERLPKVTEAYLQGRAKPTDPHVSPLFGDFTGLPPFLVQVGDREILLDDATRVVAHARDQGCPATLSIWPDMPHVFQLFAPDLRPALEALEEVARFLRAHAIGPMSRA